MADAEPLSLIDREAAFEAAVERNLRRNMIANFIHGMLGMTGFRIVYAPTLIPAYLLLISGSTVVVGLGQSLLQIGIFAAPLVSAAALEHRRFILPAAMHYGSAMRVAVLGLALAGYFLGGVPLVVATLLCLLLLGLFNGMQRVAFQMVLSKLIPQDRRGRLQGWRNVIGGSIAAIMSYVAGRWLIAGNVWGNGYATTFLFAFILTSLGLIALRVGVIEPEAPSVRPKVGVMARMRDIPALTRNGDYRWFLVAQALAMIGRIAAPFYIIIATRSMPLDGGTVGVLSIAFLGADTASNLLWGYLGDRSGYRLTFIASLLFMLGGLGLLAFAHGSAAFIAAFAMVGIGGSGYQMSAQTMVLEFGAREDLPMRIALSAMVEGGMAALAPIIGGVVLQEAGVEPLIIAAAVPTIAAIAALGWKVRDPRLRRLHLDEEEALAKSL